MKNTMETAVKKKLIFWIVVVAVLVGLFFLLVNMAPWFYAGLVLGWAGKCIYDRLTAKKE